VKLIKVRLFKRISSTFLILIEITFIISIHYYTKR